MMFTNKLPFAAEIGADPVAAQQKLGLYTGQMAYKKTHAV
jgi:hypothetical protein